MIIKSEVIDKTCEFIDSNRNKFAIWTLRIIDNTGKEQFLKVVTAPEEDITDINMRSTFINARIENLMKKQNRDNFIFLGRRDRTGQYTADRYYQMPNGKDAQTVFDEDLPLIKDWCLLLDTKKAFSYVMNRKNSKEVQEVIDALFTNVWNIYNDFKDDVPYVDAQNEYEFHLFRPKGIPARYDLLTFLLNRAITNVDAISPLASQGNGNAYDHKRIVYINEDRYSKYRGKENDEWIRLSYIKSKLHETGHALHVKVSPNGKFRENNILNSDMDPQFAFCSASEKIEMMRNLMRIYGVDDKRMIKMDTIKKADHQDGPLGRPVNRFVDESATEYYATKYSGLYRLLHQYKRYRIGNGMFVCTPNHSNAYSPTALLMYHFENLTSKKSMFNSLFLGKTLNIIEEFYDKYRDVIEDVCDERYSEYKDENFLIIARKGLNYNELNGNGLEQREFLKAHIFLSDVFLRVYQQEFEKGIFSEEKMNEIMERLELISPHIIYENGVKYYSPEYQKLEHLYKSITKNKSKNKQGFGELE